MNRHEWIRPEETPDYEDIRARVTILDRDASMRRNASHLSAKAQAHINRIERESARLSTALPEMQAAKARRNAESYAQKALFERGHQIYLEKQAPKLALASQALCDLSLCALPGALDKQITSLITEFDRHTAQMSHYSPGTGIPPAMQKLLPLLQP